MSGAAAAPGRTGPFGMPSVADVLNPRSNAIGLLRLTFALLVLVDHSWPIALGEDSPVHRVTFGQTDLGNLSVIGFFVLSGLLVTRSARRSSIGRFAWHRALRILPAFWVCLLLMAFVLGPVLWWADRGSLAGYLGADPSPVGFVLNNLFTSMQQYGIGDLLTDTPYGEVTGTSTFNGSLWTLRYEVLCYVGAAVFTLWAVFRKRPLLVLVPAFAVLYAATIAGWLAGGDRFGNDDSALGWLPALPLIGAFNLGDLVVFGLVFVIGAFAAMRPDRFPISAWIGVPAAVVALATMRFGGWDVAGLPAFAYVVLWAATRLPRRLHRVNTEDDVSYGVYIYAWPIQQILVTLDVQRFGLPVFIALAAVLAWTAGRLSWEFLEEPVLAYKDADPPWRRAAAQRSEEPVTHATEEPLLTPRTRQ